MWPKGQVSTLSADLQRVDPRFITDCLMKPCLGIFWFDAGLRRLTIIDFAGLVIPFEILQLAC